MGQSHVRATAVATGRVQGVFFRSSAMEEAQRLGLTGWIRNLPDGGVEAQVEGPRHQVEGFLSWFRDGPSHADVAHVDVTWGEATGEFGTFRVLR